MSDLFDEEVIPMPPVSVAMLEEIATEVLALIAPEHLLKPGPLDVLFLAEHVLPARGIHIEAASAAELGSREGATDPVSDGRDINVLIVESLWRELLRSPTGAKRARATILHELAHALLHVHEIRKRMQMRPEARRLLLARRTRRELKAYEDPEWQAWALAGCIAMPRRTLLMMQNVTVWRVASTYGVSEVFARSHLQRLKMPT